MVKAAFLGLGVMGYPMASHLVRAGHALSIWNRTGTKTQQWMREHGMFADRCKQAQTPADAVCGAQHVFLCLGDDPDLLAVYDAMEAGLGDDMVIVDHTTASPGLARALHARAHGKGATFLDAPISGGQAGAEKGILTVMCGGTETAFERARPVMASYAARMTLIGESGAGQLAKSINQICIAGILQGLAEGLHFAAKSGLDIARVVEAISGGAAQSWQMDNRWETMRDGHYQHGFAVDWMRKDLRIALETARQTGASLPLTAMIDQYYADIQAMGGQRWDTSSLLARMDRT